MRPLNRYHRRICEALSRRGILYMEEYPIGPYSVDIYLPELGRLIEIDGPFHMRRADTRRTEEIAVMRPELALVRVKLGTPLAEALERMLGDAGD